MANTVSDQIVTAHKVAFGECTVKILDDIHQKEKFLKMLFASSALANTLSYTITPDYRGLKTILVDIHREDFNLALAQAHTEQDTLRNARRIIVSHLNGFALTASCGENSWGKGERDFWNNVAEAIRVKAGISQDTL